ncbi:MAG: metallophosphoesterase [Sedimentibacter sp.]|uniref:metallophosphoesterase family protein n=1 Tax=Sedimentibacter sp. TaxID=1960295 RepID=UPI002982621B|nr:metallophosphoesterase [Sedimentibacter sp.]MDW5299491.1 metallophosphoesterase [Sedimentibacter sp.]
MKLKFIHTSDIHLGKKFDIEHFSLKEREKRRQEIWDAFDEIIKIARNEKIEYLFIAGDLTEGEYINFNSLNKISQKFNLIKETKVVMACGSSDPYNINSLYEYIQWPDNVLLVKSTDSVEKIYFSEDNLCLYSLSWDKSSGNEKSQLIYDISVDESKLNVLILNCCLEQDCDKMPVNVDLIKNKFDYCALGGNHNFEQIRNNMAYCGTPEPLSFDEKDEHGIIKGTLEKRNVEYSLQPIAKRKFITRNINLEATYSFNKILDLIKFSGDTFSNIKDYVKINLTGIVNTDISMEEIENEAKQFFYYIEFEENYSYKNTEDKNYDGYEFNIIESYKFQFENHQDKLEQQAFKLGLEVLRKEKVVK